MQMQVFQKFVVIPVFLLFLLHTATCILMLIPVVISCYSSFPVISSIPRVYTHADGYSCYLLLAVILVFPLFLLCKPYIHTEYCHLCPCKASQDAA